MRINSVNITILFFYFADNDREMWDGARVGVERAGKIFGAHEVYGIDKFEDFMRSIPRDKRIFYNDIITDQEIGGIVMDSLQGASPLTLHSLLPLCKFSFLTYLIFIRTCCGKSAEARGAHETRQIRGRARTDAP